MFGSRMLNGLRAASARGLSNISRSPLRSVGLFGAAAGAAGFASVASCKSEGKADDCNGAVVGASVVVAAVSGAALGWRMNNEGKNIQDKYDTYWPRKILILFGAPGAGKGTQAPNICKTLDLPQLSTGDMLRAAAAARTEVGLEAKAKMDAGEFVSDAIVIRIIADRIKEADCSNGFILDGFPRTLEQAQALDQMLTAQGETVTNVVNMEIPDAVLEERICGRWMHKGSGRVYHVKFNPPASLKMVDGKLDPASMKDDATGEGLYQRGDDTAEALVTRLASYHGKTVPILAHYAPKGIVRSVNANQEMDLVWADVEKAMRR